MDKGSGSGSGIFPDPDPGDQKRPDPTRSDQIRIRIRIRNTGLMYSSFLLCIVGPVPYYRGDHDHGPAAPLPGQYRSLGYMGTFTLVTFRVTA